MRISTPEEIAAQELEEFPHFNDIRIAMDGHELVEIIRKNTVHGARAAMLAVAKALREDAKNARLLEVKNAVSFYADELEALANGA